jgi:hypothetical protein
MKNGGPFAEQRLYGQVHLSRLVHGHVPTRGGTKAPGFRIRGRIILIMDNCTAHTRPEIDEACAAHGVVICPLPLHSSNQIQSLDLSTFGITKQCIARVNRMEKVNVQPGRIAQAVSSFMSAAPPVSAVGRFLSTGITLFPGTDGRQYCRVCSNRARC